MFGKIIKKVKKLAYRAAYKTDHFLDLPIIENEFGHIWEMCSPYTKLSKLSLYASCKSALYITRANIPGDIVECGIWKGGSIMAVLQVLKENNDLSRKVYLYDTYEGMTMPSDKDFALPSGKPAILGWVRDKFKSWEPITLEEARSNILKVGYPEENIHFIKGNVENTIPKIIPEEISFLRLDTDWYESTRHELEFLFPELALHGVVIVDDYGYWGGAKQAVDDYFKNTPILLQRIDQTGRLGIKIQPRSKLK